MIWRILGAFAFCFAVYGLGRLEARWWRRRDKRLAEDAERLAKRGPRLPPVLLMVILLLPADATAQEAWPVSVRWVAWAVMGVVAVVAVLFCVVAGLGVLSARAAEERERRLHRGVDAVFSPEPVRPVVEVLDEDAHQARKRRWCERRGKVATLVFLGAFLGTAEVRAVGPVPGVLTVADTSPDGGTKVDGQEVTVEAVVPVPAPSLAHDNVLVGVVPAPTSRYRLLLDALERVREADLELHATVTPPPAGTSKAVALHAAVDGLVQVAGVIAPELAAILPSGFWSQWYGKLTIALFVIGGVATGVAEFYVTTFRP